MTLETSARVAAAYSGDVDAYRRLWAPALNPLSRRLLERLDLAGAARVLDVGTGVGTLLEDLRAAAPEAIIVGADRTPAMIALAPSSFPRVVGDALVLPFADESFDVVVACFMLHHVPQPWRALEEIRRCVRPGGRVGIATWGTDTDYPAMSAWNEMLDEFGAPPADALRGGLEDMDSPEKLRDVLERAGLVVDEIVRDRCDHTFTLEGFVEYRTTMGVGKRRFDGIAPERRAEFLEAARARLTALPAGGLTDRSQTLSAVATIPA